MESIHVHGWRPIALEEVRSGGLTKNPERSLILTFDDGFASNREHAWPVLQRLGFPSATFVVTSCLGSYNKWDKPETGYHPLLSANDLAAADPELMRFHSHSETHPDLTFLQTPEAVQRELDGSRRALAQFLGAFGQFFAYPRGSWNWEIMKQVRRSGYLGACTSMEGLNSNRTNPFLLRRIEILEHDVGWRFWLKIRLGREIVRWPPNRPPEITVLAARLGRYRNSRSSDTAE
jgi:peptidoglycan/xylan/chitin deacetylase (PgdA/CDA1 family)